MHKTRCVIGLAVALIGGSVVRAGLTPLDGSSDAGRIRLDRAPAAVTVEQAAGKGAYHGESWLPSAYDLFTNPLGSQSIMTQTGGENAVVREMPPAPDSATLFLLGLGSMGAWQLTRSARKFHLGAIPEWYHTGGPLQVGHAKPYEFDFADVPAYCFASAGDSVHDVSPLQRSALREAHACPWRQTMLARLTRRGPPSSS